MKDANQMQSVPLEYYHEKYRRIDPEEASKRTGLAFDSGHSRFALNALGRSVYADWPELRLTPADESLCPKSLYGFSMQIIAARFLIEGAGFPSGGEFKAYRELPWGGVYDANFQGRCIKRLAYSFGAKLDKFAKAAESLGGAKLSLGDVSYDLPFLGGVVCRLILWGPDDEFPPSAQFLFSSNAGFAWGAEDLAGVGDIVIGALKEVSTA